MNAPERMWRDLAKRDWAAVRSQFHRTAIVQRAAGAVEYRLSA